ncbi:hypothetical protein P364_0114065 [Paenibacillus sp. MAEPY2]|nr:hypothetical protein P364_0114065 [Paenibacillus sp. MAEPY2]KGP86031.1 hypothetical protein P363_0119540 [Paenibacillus sp. MAEPY1]
MDYICSHVSIELHYNQLRQIGTVSSHALLDEYEGVGHVWEVYPDQYETEEHFFGWVYESKRSLDRIIMKDVGDGWLTFLRPGNHLQ